MAYIWPEHSQPQKPFPDLLCVGFGGFCVPCRKYCRSDAIFHENCKFSLNYIYKNYFPPCSFQASSWFQAVGNILASLLFGCFEISCCCCLFWFCFPSLKCRLIISPAFYLDFLFIGEIYLCKSTHTYILCWFHWGICSKAEDRLLLQSYKLFSKVAV